MNYLLQAGLESDVDAAFRPVSIFAVSFNIESRLDSISVVKNSPKQFSRDQSLHESNNLNKWWHPTDSLHSHLCLLVGHSHGQHLSPFRVTLCDL